MDVSAFQDVGLLDTDAPRWFQLVRARWPGSGRPETVEAGAVRLSLRFEPVVPVQELGTFSFPARAVHMSTVGTSRHTTASPGSVMVAASTSPSNSSFVDGNGKDDSGFRAAPATAMGRLEQVAHRQITDEVGIGQTQFPSFCRSYS